MRVVFRIEFVPSPYRTFLNFEPTLSKGRTFVQIQINPNRKIQLKIGFFVKHISEKMSNGVSHSWIIPFCASWNKMKRKHGIENFPAILEAIQRGKYTIRGHDDKNNI